jgi:hypothetical protein
MQERAYPASNEPLIFSKTMVGILNDDVIEVQILQRLYHTGILRKELDLDNRRSARRSRGSGRSVAQYPHHTHRACRLRVGIALGHCRAGRVRHPKNAPPIAP